MYVIEGTSVPNQPAVALKFDLPVTAASTPKVVLNPGPVVFAEDNSGNAAGVGGLGVSVFKEPLTTASTPFLFFTLPGPALAEFPAFDAAGDLFVPNANSKVFMVPHPLTSASIPTQIITDPGLTAAGAAALDSSNNLIVLNIGFFPKLLVFAPPYTDAPVVDNLVSPTYGGNIVIIGSQLFALALSGPVQISQQIDIFDLPISAASRPTFSITTGLSGSDDALQMSRDSNGNLYVAVLQAGNNGKVLVYSPPFSASSSPSVTLVTDPISPPGYAPAAVVVGKN